MSIKIESIINPITINPVSGIIINSAVNSKTEIIKKRPKWTDPYFDNFQTRIESIKNKYYKNVSRGNQEGTISLLDQFNKNLTTDLGGDIIDKGMSSEIITRIKGYAGALTAVEKTQENAKGMRVKITAGAVKEFNSLYNDVISVCEACQIIFRNNKTKKDLFVFSKILAALRGGKHRGDGGDETPPAPPAK